MSSSDHPSISYQLSLKIVASPGFLIGSLRKAYHINLAQSRYFQLPPNVNQKSQPLLVTSCLLYKTKNGTMEIKPKDHSVSKSESLSPARLSEESGNSKWFKHILFMKKRIGHSLKRDKKIANM